MRLLIVEDDLAIAEPLLAGLRHHGFDGVHVNCGADAISAINGDVFDVVLLDLGLPDMDGLDVCREIRKLSSVPVIMVTARGEEVDRIVGLELGADDYVSKPFGIRELIARIRAVRRRFDSAAELNSPSVINELDHDDAVKNATTALAGSAHSFGTANPTPSAAISDQAQSIASPMPGIRPGRVGTTQIEVAPTASHDEVSTKPDNGPRPRPVTTSTIGKLVIDHRAHRVHMDGVEVALTPKEFGLLVVLSADPGAVVPRMSIIEQVWDEHWYGPTKTLDVHVAQLRQKLGNAGWIETVRGVGYRLADPALSEPNQDPQ
jgi:DNA-binding response OmpR family regulator